MQTTSTATPSSNCDINSASQSLCLSILLPREGEETRASGHMAQNLLPFPWGMILRLGAKVVPTTEKEIERIGDIIKNARGTWFVLLGSLVFAAITLASVKDVSFFVPSQQTKLPLLGITIPVTFFFWAGAPFVTGLYAYLHICIMRLLEANIQAGDKPIADVIHPFLVSTSSLWKGELSEGGNEKHLSARPGWVRIIINLISGLLYWVLGAVVVGWFWWRSMPAHNIWLTCWLAFLFSVALFCGIRSAHGALTGVAKNRVKYWLICVFGLCFLAMEGLSVVRTRLDFWDGRWWVSSRQFKVVRKFIRPARANLSGVKIDFSDLTGARLEGANLQNASMKGVDLTAAHLQTADLSYASLQGAVLSRADMRSAKFGEALLQKAKIRKARINRAIFRHTDLQDADFSGAKMWAIDLFGANLRHTNLTDVDMNSAILVGANMADTILDKTFMGYANFSGALLVGTKDKKLIPKGVSFYGGTLEFMALRHVDLTEVDFTEIQQLHLSFGDGSVILPPGVTRPSMWCQQELSDAEYWGRYQGWLAWVHSVGHYKFDQTDTPRISISMPCPK